MVCAIITILLGICSFVMLTQPALAFYGGEGDAVSSAIRDLLESVFGGSTNGYNMLVFEEGQNTYWYVGNIFLIVAMVFCGIMILLSILNLIMQSAGKEKILGTRVFAIMFFLTALVALIMYVLFANELMGSDMEGFIQSIKDGGVVLTVGYGLICFVVASFLSIFFASGKKKKK